MKAVRAFNRFYTQRIGVLKRYLDTDYGLYLPIVVDDPRELRAGDGGEAACATDTAGAGGQGIVPAAVEHEEF